VSPRSAARRDRWSALGLAVLALGYLLAGRRYPLDMSAVLALYATTLPVLGFLLTSFALVFVAARLMGLSGWWRPAALALGVTVASRLLFGTWLSVPLP
jgi:hypothetical protein